MYKDNCFYHDTTYRKANKCRFYGSGKCALGFELPKLKSKKYLNEYLTDDYDFYGASEGSSSHKDEESENYIPQPVECKRDGTMGNIKQLINDTDLSNKQKQKEKLISKLKLGECYKRNLAKASKYCKGCPSAAIAMTNESFASYKYNSCRNIYRSSRGGNRRVCGYQDLYDFKDGNCPEYGKERHKKFLEEKYTTFK